MPRRHGSRALVAFVVLSECLAVQRGRICRIDLPMPMPSPLPLRAVGPRKSPLPSRPVFDGVHAWEELTVLFLDHRTILVRFRQRERRVTARDLGLATGSSDKPLKPFDLLLAFLTNDGRFKSWRFGDARATKQNLTRLRDAMCERFGLEEDPFHRYRRGLGWQAKFQVVDARAEREDALSPGARATLERAGKLGTR